MKNTNFIKESWGKKQISLKNHKKKGANFFKRSQEKWKYHQRIARKTEILSKDHGKDTYFIKESCKRHEFL